MLDIDNILGSKKYFYVSADPVSAVAEAIGKTADSFKKPDLGKLIAQKCGRKGFGYVFNKSKKDEFKKCSDDATTDWNKQYNTTATTITNVGDNENTKSLMEQQSANTNKILIGLGVVVVGLIGYIAIKK
jgi:hypothetical protein